MDDVCSGLSIYGKGGGSDIPESFRVSDFKSTTFHVNFGFQTWEKSTWHLKWNPKIHIILWTTLSDLLNTRLYAMYNMSHRFTASSTETISGINVHG